MNKQQEEWKKHFEENMLGGDSVEDYDKNFLSAEYVWHYISTSILPKIKVTEKDVDAEEENQKLPSEVFFSHYEIDLLSPTKTLQLDATEKAFLNLLDHLAAQHLAHRVHGQLVEHDVAPRHLVGGE